MFRSEEALIFTTQNFNHQEYKANIISKFWCIKLIVEAIYASRLIFKRLLSKTPVRLYSNLFEKGFLLGTIFPMFAHV